MPDSFSMPGFSLQQLDAGAQAGLLRGFFFLVGTRMKRVKNMFGRAIILAAVTVLAVLYVAFFLRAGLALNNGMEVCEADTHL